MLVLISFLRHVSSSSSLNLATVFIHVTSNVLSSNASGEISFRIPYSKLAALNRDVLLRSGYSTTASHLVMWMAVTNPILPPVWWQKQCRHCWMGCTPLCDCRGEEDPQQTLKHFCSVAFSLTFRYQ